MGKLGQVSIQFVFCCVLLCVVVCCCAVLVLVVVVGCCVLLWVAVYSEGLLCVVVCCSVLWCVVVCCCVCVVVCVLWYVLLYVLLYVVVCDVVLSGLLGLCKACTKGERAWGGGAGPHVVFFNVTANRPANWTCRPNGRLGRATHQPDWPDRRDDCMRRPAGPGHCDHGRFVSRTAG